MRKIKVCILTTVHEPFDDRIFHKECKTLLKIGYDVTLIAQHDKDEIVDGIKIIALPNVKTRIYRMLFLTSKTFYLALRQRACFYHFHDPELLPIGILLKLFSWKKVIYDVHEDYSKQILYKSYLPKIVRGCLAFLIKKVEYLSSKFFDGIVTATDDILSRFSSHKRSVSIKNFPILSYFPEKENNIERKENTIFNLVYIGFISKTRGIFEMVRSLEYINMPVKLTLYGDFDEQELTIWNLRGFEKVEYRGWVKHEEVIKLLPEYDVGIVCLHPTLNYQEALPVKLFEYMAAGLPVIASNFPLWKEIIENSKCWICVNPLYPEEIADAIKFFIEHPAIRKEMGERGKKAVREEYNWEKESEKLCKIYQEVLKN